jgi:hypothetical protein
MPITILMADDDPGKGNSISEIRFLNLYGPKLKSWFSTAEALYLIAFMTSTILCPSNQVEIAGPVHISPSLNTRKGSP